MNPPTPTPDPTQAAQQQQQMTTASFAAAVRKKYPTGISSSGQAYSAIPDQQLVQQIVQKYPVYQSQISDYQTPAFSGATNQLSGDPAQPFKQMPAPTPAPASPGAIAETGQHYMDNVAPAASDVNDLAKDISGGAVDDGAPEGNFGKGVDEMSKGGIANVAGGVEKAGLGLASDVAQAIFAPIAAPIQTLLGHVAVANAANPNAPDYGNVNSPEAQAARQQISDWAKAHPDIAQTFSDAFNVGGAALGSSALDATVSDTATAAKNAVVKMATSAKGAVTDTASAFKTAVVGTPEEQTARTAAQIAAKASNSAQAVTDMLKQDPTTMTQTMKTQATQDGRQLIINNKTGGTDVDFKPTKEVNRAGEIMSDPTEVNSPITPKDKPNVVLAKVNNAISQKGAAVEQFLRENPVEVTPEDETTMLNKMRADAAKTSTPTEMNAYNDQISLFQKQLEEKYTESGTLNTSDYYEALKQYEANVASKFSGGKSALIDPEGIGSAKIQAAADLRQHIRDLIGSKHPEFKPQMYDLTSLYEARDNAAFRSSRVKSQTVFQKHPRLKIGAELAGAAAVGEGARRLITGGF